MKVTVLGTIARELNHHAPFTFAGVASGIVVIFFARHLPRDVHFSLFYILHPAHVFLSAIVVASMYQLHKCAPHRHKCNPFHLLLIGYAGSVGLATLSDSIIPYLGERLLRLPHAEAHVGFIEKWWLVNPLAVAGVAIAYYWPTTKFPHAGHVLLSTWAKLFHILMALGGPLNLAIVLTLFVFLFIAVWLPCCLSDIVFPLLFVKPRNTAYEHGHSHP